MSGLGTNASRQQYKDSKFVNYRMNYYDDYITDIYIIKFEKDLSNSPRIDASRQDKKFLQYTLKDAYPKQINSMDLAYGPTDEFVRLNVTFGYSRYISERVTVPQLAQSNTGLPPDAGSPAVDNVQNNTGETLSRGVSISEAIKKPVGPTGAENIQFSRGVSIPLGN